MGRRSNANSLEEQSRAFGKLAFVFGVRKSRATWIAYCLFHAGQPAALCTGLP